mgnify:CR=1 FL=1
MPVHSEGKAPYAPAATVIEVIERYRDHGLSEPFDTETLERAGVQESLSARTLQALKLLDLLDSEGNPTEQLRNLATVPSSDYKQSIADVLHAAYAEVFSFVDPAKDELERVEDAFRTLEPRGQRGRMVTLFLGLCEYAGLIDEAPKRKTTPKRADSGTGRSAVSRPSKKPARAPVTTSTEVSQPRAPSDLPIALSALLGELPNSERTWTTAQRGSFISAFTALLDVYYPVRDTDLRGELTTGSPKN